MLVIDASVDNRVATELRARGRSAVALSQLGFHRMEDPDMLRALAEHFENDGGRFVLVTTDDAMPADHGPLLRELCITVATIDPRVPTGVTQDAWSRDVIHRWAHAIGAQAIGSWRRYTFHRNGQWRARRRPVRAHRA